jgi:hypothetical protein
MVQDGATSSTVREYSASNSGWLDSHGPSRLGSGLNLAGAPPANGHGYPPPARHARRSGSSGGSRDGGAPPEAGAAVAAAAAVTSSHKQQTAAEAVPVAGAGTTAMIAAPPAAAGQAAGGSTPATPVIPASPFGLNPFSSVAADAWSFSVPDEGLENNCGHLDPASARVLTVAAAAAQVGYLGLPGCCRGRACMVYAVGFCPGLASAPGNSRLWRVIPICRWPTRGRSRWRCEEPSSRGCCRAGRSPRRRRHGSRPCPSSRRSPTPARRAATTLAAATPSAAAAARRLVALRQMESMNELPRTE